MTGNTFTGEIVALIGAFSWTASALFFEYAGKRIGSVIVNLLRLIFAFLLLGGMLFFTTGSALPIAADGKTWFWMGLSGVVGFVFGDLCLFYSYVLITSRFSQLIMTLASPFAAISGLLILDERIRPLGILGMVITISGIALSILKRSGDESNKIKINLPIRGVIFALLGAIGQGVGIVLSKKGMNYYETSINGNQNLLTYMPFAATQIRIIVGVVGFVAIIFFTGRGKQFFAGLRDRRGVAATFGGSIFGPFIGVSLSLMAVLYTATGIASTILATVPIIILAPYAIIYRKRISFYEVLGAVISVAGVALFFI